MVRKLISNSIGISYFPSFDAFERSKDGIVLSVNQEISGDKRKYEIIGKYDLIVKIISSNDSGRYLCQNFDQALSMTVVLNVLSKYRLK